MPSCPSVANRLSGLLAVKTTVPAADSVEPMKDRLNTRGAGWSKRQ